MNNLHEKYKKETGRNAHTEYNRSGYSDLYVKWLEKQLIDNIETINQLKNFIPNELKGVSNNEQNKKVCDCGTLAHVNRDGSLSCANPDCENF